MNAMNAMNASAEDYVVPRLFEIRIKGYLDDRRAAGFDGLAVTREKNGITLLSGKFDQAALLGLLRKVRDLGMPLVSVNQVEVIGTHPTHSEQETNE